MKHAMKRERPTTALNLSLMLWFSSINASVRILTQKAYKKEKVILSNLGFIRNDSKSCSVSAALIEHKIWLLCFRQPRLIRVGSLLKDWKGNFSQHTMLNENSAALISTPGWSTYTSHAQADMGDLFNSAGWNQTQIQMGHAKSVKDYYSDGLRERRYCFSVRSN